jgi:hypothetical protein
LAVRLIPYSSARIYFGSFLLESLDDSAHLALGQTIYYSPDARVRLYRSRADAARNSESFASDLGAQQLSGALQVVAEVRSVGVVSEKADSGLTYMIRARGPLDERVTNPDHD